jgi:hypothetical protein
MDALEALRKADFSKGTASHKEALREALFGKAAVRELTLDDLEDVTAASKSWYEREKNPP